MTIAGRIAKLENGNPAGVYVQPINKRDDETRTAFATRVTADAQTGKAGS